MKREYKKPILIRREELAKVTSQENGAGISSPGEKVPV